MDRVLQPSSQLTERRYPDDIPEQELLVCARTPSCPWFCGVAQAAEIYLQVRRRPSGSSSGAEPTHATSTPIDRCKRAAQPVCAVRERRLPLCGW